MRTEVLEAARNAGLHITYLGPESSVTGRHHDLADSLTALPGLTPEQAVRTAIALHREAPFDLALTAGDTYLQAVAQINHELGLGANPLRTTSAVNDKALMRDVLRGTAVRQVAAAKVRNRDDLREFAAAHGFPVILKPARGTGSTGIHVVTGLPELESAAEELDSSGAGDGEGAAPWVVEEFLVGREFSVETHSTAGEHHLLAVTEKFTNDNRVEIGHVVPARITPSERAALADETKAVLTALGVQEGPGHTEMILTGRGPRLIETHTRPGGDAIVELVRLATGFDIHQLTFSWLSGEPVDMVREPFAGAAAIWFCTPPEGRVTAVGGVAEALAREGVEDAVLTAAVGDVIPPVRNSEDRAGFAFATGADADTALARAKESVAQFVVELADAADATPAADVMPAAEVMPAVDVTPAVAAAERPLLLLIGSGGQVWREYMLRSMATEYRVHLFCPEPPTWELPHIEGHSVVDTLDVEAMTALARATAERFSGVLTYEETRVEATAGLATALGLRTSPPGAVRACRDKYTGREALRRAGVPQAASIAVAGLEEAREAADRIGYPVVVKPRALSASCGVTLAAGPEQLEQAFEEAGRIWFDEVAPYERPILVEEFLDGPEISVEAVCRDGRVTALFVAHKSLGYAPGFEETGHLVMAGDPLLDDPRLLKVLQDAHTAVGLTDTVTHTELRLTGDGPRVVEINARVGGDRIPYLGGLATGVDIGLIAADLAVGAEPGTEPTRSAVAAIRFLYPDQDLTTASVEVDRDRLPDGTHEVRILAGPGKELRLPPKDPVRSRYAFVIAVAGTEKSCTAALDEAAAAVTVHGTPLA
ncbi:ATP-grasp domain-containing protein [Streptomyces roseifaciens]|uniref:ATP-grasp domain-containing protein n=1 Tax=Streptomyces roseifaciens TaxID=1488406 RepID=UPI000D14D2D1|nr:ATP-grasp domain-containing protein [Streptomyces roseifaciens]